MALYERNTRFSQYSRTDGRFQTTTDDEVPLGELFRRLGQDASALVRNEIALAKLEMRESAKEYTQGAARLGLAAVPALVGVLSFAAFAIIGLGDLINNYWLSALIVAVLHFVAAAIMASSARARLKRSSLAPQETVQTLKEDQRWAKNEAVDFKRQLKA